MPSSNSSNGSSNSSKGARVAGPVAVAAGVDLEANASSLNVRSHTFPRSAEESIAEEPEQMQTQQQQRRSMQLPPLEQQQQSAMEALLHGQTQASPTVRRVISLEADEEHGEESGPATVSCMGPSRRATAGKHGRTASAGVGVGMGKSVFHGLTSLVGGKSKAKVVA
eukprot:TRINITY_DN12044_c0_g1_i1.p1 TRINITY_DN12044_c0_g1~~TRINITY_DN12044_c0_g1_i1.p1  ORF type:complete len:193 (-),score=2.96 TRINITY_DN12044_c0_g1_i1:89-589(-)